jgi:hypothetical protein
MITLTCPSYGRVREDGTPANPATYDHPRAARDALAFAALFDRFVQNLRRYLGSAGSFSVWVVSSCTGKPRLRRQRLPCRCRVSV